jgi:hypothetical protein
MICYSAPWWHDAVDIGLRFDVQMDEKAEHVGSTPHVPPFARCCARVRIRH